MMMVAPVESRMHLAMKGLAALIFCLVGRLCKSSAQRFPLTSGLHSQPSGP